MTVTEPPQAAERRLVVRHEPQPGEPPWRAVVVYHSAIVSEGEGVTTRASIPVGRFDSQAEAIRTGCTALRFVSAGIPWRVQP